MRHKYDTRGLVLARAPWGEAHAHLAILTPDVGLVWARAAGVRHAKSKLAHALVTFAESDVTLVRGREGWRVTGAVLQENWFVRLPDGDARCRAARVTGLLLRLAPTEVPERELSAIAMAFLAALAEAPPDLRESAELIAAANLLAVLGFDAETAPENTNAAEELFSHRNLESVKESREPLVLRINRGIVASGL